MITRLSEKLRNLFFWAFDHVTGGSVRSHLKDIEKIMSFSNAEMAVAISARLTNILNYATSTTPFYFQYRGIEDIQQFPVLDKNSIRVKLDHLLSEEFTAKERIPAITSGSTGTPFKTFQSKEKNSRNTADTMFFANLAGYQLGNKLYYFKIWSEYNKKSKFRQYIQNIFPVDVLNLKSKASTVIDELNTNKRSVSLLGYVSAFETLCKELDRGNRLDPKLKVQSIITMSEGLDDYTKQVGQKYFGCPVLSRYSNIENGILAQQTLADPINFLINRASYFIEILHIEKDEPVPNGVLGRIIVTDFFNRVMPMIRYDTGDLGVKDIRSIEGVSQDVLTRIEGRKLDQIFNTRGELISSYIVYKNMWSYTEIEQYQFVQKGKREYVFKISTPNKFEKEHQLVNEFKSYLGQDAVFKVEYVQEIPLLSSGKRKKVVNEMRNV
ncbi:MAG: hypothetical protein ORN54_08830 [Cyclobacteriaceae bacterium]|nr:hypothetical protein [Cyclobacteriaceae bacterium]